MLRRARAASRVAVVVGHGSTIEIRPLSSSRMLISILRASQSPGMSSATAAVTNTCSADAATFGQRPPARGVQFGEYVVEQQHRIAALGAQQLVGRQPQRQRHRPRFPMAGKAFRDLVAEAQLEIVAMRADQADAALELGVAAPRQRIQQRRLEDLGVVRVASPSICSTLLRYRIAAGRDAGASS